MEGYSTMTGQGRYVAAVISLIMKVSGWVVQSPPDVWFYAVCIDRDGRLLHAGCVCTKYGEAIIVTSRYSP